MSAAVRGDEGVLVVGAEEYPLFDSFDDMDLPENLLRGIYGYGFEKPSEIQQRAIRPMVEGRDTIGLAPSGTGKTAAYMIGALARVDLSLSACQVLVLVGNRMHAMSIRAAVVSLCGDHLHARARCCAGGTSVREDIDALRACQHLVFGTPGRMLDMIGKGHLGVAQLRMLILDEADAMISLGFKEQIYDVFKRLHPEVQLCLFSETMPQEILELTEKFMREPVRILVKREELTIESIQQFYIALENEEYKLETLLDLCETLTVAPVLIYCNSQRKADFLAKDMVKRDVTVSLLHAGLGPEEQKLAMRELRSGSSRLVISGNILPRGINVPLEVVSLVINYDLPNVENYLYRIGRPARFRRNCGVINFVTKQDVQAMREIERRYATQIEELPFDFADRI